MSLAVLAAGLHCCAGPPLEWWPLAFVAVVPLCVSLAGRSRLQATALGGLCGLVTIAVGYVWLPETLLRFSTLPPVLLAAGVAGFGLYHAGRWALFGWLLASLTSRWRFSLAVLAAHTTVETVYPLTFPWYLGAALHGVPVLLQLAEIGGTLAVSALVAAVNAGLASAVLKLVRLRALRLHILRELAPCSVVLLAAVGFGRLRMAQVRSLVSEAPRATIGLVQPNLDPLLERDGARALEKQLDLSRALLSKARLDFLLWSESAVPSAEHERYAAERFGRMLANRLPVPTLFGATVLRSGDGAAESQFNSAFLSDRAGGICKSCRYDKQVLLPFGEYVPAESWLPALREGLPNTGNFVAGPRRRALHLGERRLAVTLCYEDLHGTYVNELVARDRAHLIVNLTNDAWFHGTSAARWHLALAKFRAIEQRRYLARATNSGVSVVIDPAGVIVARAPASVEATLTADVAWLDARTPFSYVGHVPWWVSSLLTLAVALAKRSKRRGASGGASARSAHS